MINGGLGLLLSGDGSKGDYIAYGVVAGVAWVAYLSVVICVRDVRILRRDSGGSGEKGQHDARDGGS